MTKAGDLLKTPVRLWRRNLLAGCQLLALEVKDAGAARVAQARPNPRPRSSEIRIRPRDQRTDWLGTSEACHHTFQPRARVSPQRHARAGEFTSLSLESSASRIPERKLRIETDASRSNFSSIGVSPSKLSACQPSRLMTTGTPQVP